MKVYGIDLVSILVSTQMWHYKRRVKITEYKLMLIVDLILLVRQVMAETKGYYDICIIFSYNHINRGFTALTCVVIVCGMKDWSYDCTCQNIYRNEGADGTQF